MSPFKSAGKIIVYVTMVVVFYAAHLYAQPPKASLDGFWSVKYPNGSEGVMTVEKDDLKISIPVIGEIKGKVDLRGEYFESILSDRRNGVDFIFGYVKGGKVEGKLQERKPCTELNKAFKNGVVATGSSCQAPFTAVKK